MANRAGVARGKFAVGVIFYFLVGAFTQRMGGQRRANFGGHGLEASRQLCYETCLNNGMRQGGSWGLLSEDGRSTSLGLAGGLPARHPGTKNRGEVQNRVSPAVCSGFLFRLATRADRLVNGQSLHQLLAVHFAHLVPLEQFHHAFGACEADFDVESHGVPQAVLMRSFGPFHSGHHFHELLSKMRMVSGAVRPELIGPACRVRLSASTTFWRLPDSQFPGMGNGKPCWAGASSMETSSSSKINTLFGAICALRRSSP